MAVDQNAIELPLAPGYTMYLTGQTTRTTYGRMVPWSENVQYMTDLYEGIGTHPSEGLILLQIQEKLYSFLVKVTTLLLPELDVTSEPLQSLDARLQTPEGQMGRKKVTTDPIQWQALNQMNFRAQYDVPSGFDLVYQQRLASAKRDEAEDHVWSLREDPVYLRESVEEELVHSKEVERQAFLRAGRKLPRSDATSVFTEACRVTIGRSYARVVYWNIVLEDLKGLKVLQDRDEAQHGPDSPNQKPSSEYDKALRNYVVDFLEVFDHPLAQLEGYVATSGPFQQYFEIEIYLNGFNIQYVRILEWT